MKTVLLVEDHTLVRSGMKTMLEMSANMEVIGEAGDGRAGVQLFGQLKPDLVIMDVAMPNLNGIEAARADAGGEFDGADHHAVDARGGAVCDGIAAGGGIGVCAQGGGV